MLKLTCYQCHNTFSDEEPFCPHCGAVRKENPAQAGMRLAQRFAKGALLGGIIGLGLAIIASGCYIVYGHVFKNLAHGFEWDTVKMYGGLGLVVGALIGGVAKIVRQLAKEE
jgi:hypothetical protein